MESASLFKRCMYESRLIGKSQTVRQALHEKSSKQPSALLDSTLPRAFLINELRRIRARMFHRLSDEGLSDVVATNSILNALYYRTK
jgi:hypothetical protein